MLMVIYHSKMAVLEKFARRLEKNLKLTSCLTPAEKTCQKNAW